MPNRNARGVLENPVFGLPRKKPLRPPTMRRWAVAAAMTASLLMPCAIGHAAPPLPVGPAAGDIELSPFYRWDGPPAEKPGSLLRQESLPDQAEMDGAGTALRLLYSSTDARWESGQIPVSGTLFLPRGTPPAGGWPLVAWAHGTLGIADVCAPSWTGFRPRDATYFNRWLKAGFAVVVTDYQGLGGPGPHPYLYWQAEGRSVLDSIRAAFKARLGLIANQTLIAGQSQGSGAALGAARLARGYAPELKLIGLVTTGLNSTFPDGPVMLPVRNSANMFLSFAAGGLRDDAPAFETLVNAKGRQLLDIARSACTKEVGKAARALEVGSLADTLSISLEQLASLRLNVTDMPVQDIGIPVLVGTGLADATIPPIRQHAAVAALCSASPAIIWRRYEGLGHDGALHGSFDDSLAFAHTIMAGKPVTGTCKDIIPPGPPGARDKNAPFNDD